MTQKLMSSSRGAIDALFLSAAAALGDAAPAGGVFLRAAPHAALRDFAPRCLQTFRPLYDALVQAGAGVEDSMPASAPYALYLCTRQREENRLNLARLWSLLPAGGALVCAQDNDLGAKAVEKDLRDLCGPVEVLSKYHSRALCVFKADADAALLAAWLSLEQPRRVAGTELVAAPGMFSWKDVDAGSALLAAHLPSSLGGRGADFGAGWGYLSHHALQACSGIAHIDLYEAEKTALDCAAQNLAPFGGRFSCHWADLQAQDFSPRYDFILCNPPVHHLDAQDVALGQVILSRGLSALKAGGRMYVVANRHLPYEALLASQGAQVRALANAAGYKVLEVAK